MKVYQKEFMQFLSEVKHLKDAEKAKYEMTDEFSNVVLLSGEILGEDTRNSITNIGKQYGLLVMTNGLRIIYRIPKPTFIVH